MSLERVVLLLKRIHAVEYTNVACTTLVVYDYILALEEEVRLVWSAKWTSGKIMYLLTRYLVFLDCFVYLYPQHTPNLSISTCRAFNAASIWLSFATIAVAEVIMMIRTYAFWCRNPYVGITFVLLLIGVVVPDTILLIRYVKSVEFMQSPYPTKAACIISKVDSSVYVDLILIMVSQFIVVGFTLVRWFVKWSTMSSHFVNTLVSDGLLYSISMLCISLANVIVMKLVVAELSTILLLFQVVFHSMLSSRLLLQLREISRDPSGAMTGSVMTPISPPARVLWPSKVSTLKFATPTPKTSEGTTLLCTSDAEQRVVLLGGAEALRSSFDVSTVGRIEGRISV